MPGITPGRLHELDIPGLRSLLTKGVPLVDIRRPDEWRATGVVEGSRLLTFYDAAGNYDLLSWLAALQIKVSKEQPLILICRTGHRTRLLGEMLLEKRGCQSLFHVTDGIMGWIAAGYPVEDWDDTDE